MTAVPDRQDDTGSLTPWLVGLALVVMIWTAVALPARATHNARTTADEPQYLLSALSLGEDGDLDIADELEERRYEPFHEITVDTQTEVRDDGTRISPHDPLLPVVLAPAMRVGGWVAAKATLVVLAGLLAVALLWVAVRRLDVPVAPAALVVGAFACTPPLVAYGTQVYPELPAALAVTAGLGALLGPLHRRAQVVTVVAVVALPWLSVKYALVAAVLAGALLVGLARDRRRSDAIGVLVVLASATIVYVVGHRILYGGWTAYASGDHFVDGETGVIGFAPDYLGRSRRLVGLLVDRDFGLAAWAPLYLLAVPALAAVGRARPRGWWILVVTVGAGWVTATFVALTMHGWWWPGRQVVVVVPVIVLAVAWWVARVRWAAAAVVVGAAIGLLSWSWLLVEILVGSRTLVVDFMETANPVSRGWRWFLPDGRHPSGLDDLVSGVWALVLAVSAVVGWRSVSAPGADLEREPVSRRAAPRRRTAGSRPP